MPSPSPSPSRRAVTKAASAVLGTVAAAPTLNRFAPTERPPRPGEAGAGPAATPRAVATVSQGGPLRLRSEPGGVRAADVALDALADREGTGGARAARAARHLDTGQVETDTFSMLGVTWRGSATTVLVRTRAAGSGSWSPWTRLHPLVDGPDPSSGEGDPTLRATEPTWVGAADALHLRVVGDDARGLSLSLIEPEAADVPAGAAAARAVAGTAAATTQAAVATAATVARRRRRRRRSRLRPPMRTRKSWGAEESLRDGKASFNHTIKQVHVHHTVNSNDYRRAEVAGLIRGMYRYHTRSLGWSDIGYNFLVDRFGRIWVGRAGGAGRPVRGAHTLGFNHSSTGVSVIGNFETGKPNRRIIRALTKVAAWKLHRYGRSPRGSVTMTSEGSDRYPGRRRVRVRTVDGHRDTNETACPGTNLYRRIPSVRRRAARRIAYFT